MTSPFRRNKKERRRLRKQARKSIALGEELRETNPEWTAMTKRLADLDLRMAGARRRGASRSVAQRKAVSRKAAKK